MIILSISEWMTAIWLTVVLLNQGWELVEKMKNMVK